MAVYWIYAIMATHTYTHTHIHQVSEYGANYYLVIYPFIRSLEIEEEKKETKQRTER